MGWDSEVANCRCKGEKALSYLLPFHKPSEGAPRTTYRHYGYGGRVGRGSARRDDISCISACLLICRHFLARAAATEWCVVRAGFPLSSSLISLQRPYLSVAERSTEAAQKSGQRGSGIIPIYATNTSFWGSGSHSLSSVTAFNLGSPVQLWQWCPFEHGVTCMEHPAPPSWVSPLVLRFCFDSERDADLTSIG